MIKEILKILSWFFNPERWSARKKDKKYKEIKKWENILAKALQRNNVKMISIARYTLRTLREKYDES